MRFIPTVFLATLTIVGQSQMAFSQQPISKGDWSYKDGKPESVTFVYGTTLTVKEIDQLSSYTSLTRIVMGYAGVDSEFVEIEGDFWKLGRLQNLEEVHLCVDAMNDDDLRFIALLPTLQTLEFNADNGYDDIHEIPICTDRCADHLRSAKTLRSLVIHDGQFTDKFVARIAEGLPNLEELSLNSAELTDESLRLLADRCSYCATCRTRWHASDFRRQSLSFNRIRHGYLQDQDSRQSDCGTPTTTGMAAQT